MPHDGNGGRGDGNGLLLIYNVASRYLIEKCAYAVGKWRQFDNNFEDKWQ